MQANKNVITFDLEFSSSAFTKETNLAITKKERKAK